MTEEDEENDKPEVSKFAKGFMGLFDTEKAEELENQIEEMFGDRDSIEVDQAFLEGVGSAMEFARDAGRGQPLFEARERVLHDGESIALHVILENPDAELYQGTQDILVRSGDLETTFDPGFEVGRIEETEMYGDNVAEYVLYPADYEPPDLDGDEPVEMGEGGNLDGRDIPDEDEEDKEDG